jgi:hypothetical protein
MLQVGAGGIEEEEEKKKVEWSGASCFVRERGLVRGLLQFSRCELLLLEAGS